MCLFSYDYCYSFDHDVNSFPLFGRLHRLEILASFNRELHSRNLIKTNLSLGSPTPKVRICEDFDIRSVTSLPLGHKFHVDKDLANHEQVSDPLSLLVVHPHESLTQLATPLMIV